MNLTCPHCSHRFSLEAATEDESGRALMALLGRVGYARELVAYLGLFRPRTQGLRWSRALALALDVEQLGQAHGEPAIAAALRETVEAMRPKRGPHWRPLRNHNYLQRVLESVAVNTPQLAPNGAVTPAQSTPAPRSQTAAAMAALMEDLDD